MTDKPTPTDAELKAMWQIHAADIGGIFDYARAVLAKWGQPAQAAEPFCWQWENTFNGGTGAVKKNPETLGINMSHPDYKWTALYTAPQPTHAQAASSAVLKAIREANMQLVRTGDDAFMLVPYKAAKAQAAEPVAWLRNTTDPQPHAVTNLKYRSAVDAKSGVEYIPVFAAPQPVAREPLTDEQIQDLLLCGNPTDEEMRLIRIGWDAAHGIKGGQHGTE